MTREDLLKILRTVDGLPVYGKGECCRTVYEADGSHNRGAHRFYVDFALYPGGSSEEVPQALIRELETEGVLVRAFPNSPHINAWRLADGE
jgi:hypothetical protein